MHGSFTTYGYEVVTWLTQDASDRVDPLLILFPRFHIIDVFLKLFCTLQCSLISDLRIAK